MAKSSNTGTLIEIAVVAGVGWFIYKLLDKGFDSAKDYITDAAKAVTNAIAQPIASAYIKLTVPEPVNVTGAAILPDGRAIAFNDLAVKKMPNVEAFYFDYQFRRYQLGNRTAQGNYPTKLLGVTPV